MSLKEQLKTDAQTILNLEELAIEAIYKKQDGSEAIINCLLDATSTNNLLRGAKEVEDTLIAHTDIDFAPTTYDKLVINGEIYTVKSFDKNDLFTSLHLSINNRATGKNYGFRS